MGFDISATHTIFFIAAVVIAAGTVGVFNQSVQNFAGDFMTRSNSISEELSTDVRIINDPAAVPNGPVVLYVLNTGTKSLAPSEVVVLVNGQPHTDIATDVLDSADEVWRAGQVLEVTLTGLSLGGGDHRIRVITENGVSDLIRFTV